MLELDRIRVQFRGLRALDDLSITVAENEILGVIGPNGAGKTTLFNAVTGFVRPSSGTIRLDGTSLVGRSPEHICRRGVVRTFQVAKPFAGMSVLENVVAGAVCHTASLAEAHHRALVTVKQVGLEPMATHLAGGLPVALRKRLELARAVATGARVICMDEVMGGLNPTEVEEAMGVVRELRSAGRTIVTIEHNMGALMRLVDRVVVMNSGALLAEGSPHEVSRDPDVIQAYLGDPDGTA